MEWVGIGAAAYAAVYIMQTAYRIRMAAIDIYGPVVHEFE
jgi:hypothetical protein